MNEVDTASVGSFNFPNFLNMMLRLSILTKWMLNPLILYSRRKVDEINAEDEIREAFKVFDSVRLNFRIVISSDFEHHILEW